MEFIFSTALIPLIIGAIIPGVLAVYIWRRRSAKGAVALNIMMILLFLWGMTYILELASINLATKTFWNNITFIFIAFTPLAWITFSLIYTGYRNWLKPWVFYPVLMIPVATIIIIFTPALRPWFWGPLQLIQEGSFLILSGEHGWWYWNVHAIYSYISLLGGFILLIRALLRWPRQYRGQMIWTLAAMSVPWVANIITIFHLLPISIDLTPFAFGIMGLGLTLAVVRHRMLDLVPIGREVVVDGMQDGILMLDIGNRVVDINPAASRLIGTGSDTIGMDLAQALAAWPEISQRQSNLSESRDEVYQHKDGLHQWLEFVRTPLKDKSNNLLGSIITVRDITQIKELQKILLDARDKALEASQLKSRFLAKVSHELRTPLGGILGYAELLQSGDFGSLNEKQARVINSMIQSSNHLNSLVTDLLDQAQIEANSVVLQKSQFKPADLLDRALTGVSLLASNKGLTVTPIIDSNLPDELYGDERRLKQVIINLAGNAVKFTKEGEVKVEFQRAGKDQWSIIVADTGSGIPLEEQPHIFDPFKQADDDLLSENRGVGLGLSITRDLVTLMGGNIHMESTPGRGTTFKITLPLEQS